MSKITWGWTVPRDLGVDTVVTIGSFDGFHRAHQALILYAVERARTQAGACLLITFEPHPAKVVGQRSVRLLQAPNQRLRWLQALPVDHVWIIPFTLALAQLTPEEFLERYVWPIPRIREIVVGYDFRYGRARGGDVHLLARYAQVHGVRLWVTDAIRVRDVPCHSSEVRRCILEGRVDEARDLLGRPYGIVGAVQRGEGLGRMLGFPTANVSWRNDLVPAPGVYVTVCRWQERLWPSVTNVGFRPTVGGRRLQIETHFLDADIDLYGTEVEVFFLERIRAERRFSSLDALRQQIATDVEAARRVFHDRPVDTWPARWFEPVLDTEWYQTHRSQFGFHYISL